MPGNEFNVARRMKMLMDQSMRHISGLHWSKNVFCTGAVS